MYEEHEFMRGDFNDKGAKAETISEMHGSWFKDGTLEIFGGRYGRTLEKTLTGKPVKYVARPNPKGGWDIVSKMRHWKGIWPTTITTKEHTNISFNQAFALLLREELSGLYATGELRRGESELTAIRKFDGKDTHIFAIANRVPDTTKSVLKSFSGTRGATSRATTAKLVM